MIRAKVLFSIHSLSYKFKVQLTASRRLGRSHSLAVITSVNTSSVSRRSGRTPRCTTPRWVGYAACMYHNIYNLR